MKIVNKLRRNALFPMAIGLLLLPSAASYAARCEYLIQSEWNTGFVAAIRITNDTNTSINSWSVNWAYSDGTQRTGGWNANFSGNNPYSASGVGWNDRINPGQFVEFGVQGNKGVANNPATKPVVAGAVCTSKNSSSALSSVANSSLPSSASNKSSSSIITRSSSSTLPSSQSSRSVSSHYTGPDSSSSRSSSPTSISSSSSSSYRAVSSSSIFSSSSTSSISSGNPPVAELQTTQHGLSVFVDASLSSDAEGNPLTYSIDFGDGNFLSYPKAWHSYKQSGNYSIVLSVSDGQSVTTKTQQISVQAMAGNQAPIARLTGAREYLSIVAHGSSSFDFEGIPLTYEWDFGDGPFIGDPRASVRDCETGDTQSRSRLVTLTVSDGELKDTIQRLFSGFCNSVYDLMPSAEFTYQINGNTVSVDASASRDDIRVSWDFGDGATGVGLFASHTYVSQGTYSIKLNVAGPSLFSNSTSQSVTIGSSSSFSSNSSSSWRSSSLSSSAAPNSSSSFSKTSSSEASRQSSAVRSSSSQGSSDRNRYTAPRATTAPIIDGVVDNVWERASWAPIDVFWLGTQPNPSAQDYSGRYKALWDENYLYLLFDITDDKIFDGVRDALDRYWEDDTVELFIDENKNGGQHGYNTSAWAYHISTYGDVVDSTTGGAKLLNDHIDVRMVSNGNQHYWEMRVRIYGEDYADWKTNTPLTLSAGKLMGFSACYIDNDGSPQRESMMGSVDTQGHKNNQGYLDAGVFGSLLLVE